MDKKIASSKWVNGIDSIRFFLALIVFLSHIHDPYIDVLKNSHSPVLHALGLLITPIFSGTSAVIAFFIISGFVIHYPNKNKKLDTRKFLIRRWIRIGIPLIIIGSIAHYYGIYRLIPVWSLYCELIYYTIYPFLIKLKWTWKLKFYIAFAISIILILLFGRLDVIAFIHQDSRVLNGQYWQFGVLLTWIIGLPCWLLGVVLAEEFDTMNKNISTLKIWLFRIFIFAVSVFIQIIRFKYYTSTLISENFFALLLFLWLRNEFAYYKTHKSIPFLEYFGKFSYSLYLCHELIVFFLNKIITLSVYTYSIYIFFTILFAYFVYLFVEYPSHKLAQWLTRRKITI